MTLAVGWIIPNRTTINAVTLTWLCAIKKRKLCRAGKSFRVSDKYSICSVIFLLNNKYICIGNVNFVGLCN